MKEVNRSGNLATVLMLTPTTVWFLFLLALPLVVVFVFSFGERAAAGGYTASFTLAQYANLTARLTAFKNTMTLAPLGADECPLMAISRHSERCARESALPPIADIRIAKSRQCPLNARYYPNSGHWRGYR